MFKLKYDPGCYIIDHIMTGSLHRHSGCPDVSAAAEILRDLAHIHFSF